MQSCLAVLLALAVGPGDPSAALAQEAAAEQTKDTTEQLTDEQVEQASRKAAQLYQQKRFSDALPIAQAVLQAREARQGPNDFALAAALTNLGLVYEALDEPAKARPLLERAVPIIEQEFGPDHPHTIQGYRNLGGLYLKLEQFENSRTSWARVLSWLEQQENPKSRDLFEALVGLAEAAEGKDDFGTAKQLYERALAIVESELGPEHGRVAIVLNKLGSVEVELSNYEAARDAFRRAYPIVERTIGADHPALVHPLIRLARLNNYLGDWAAAEARLERAAAIQEKALDPEHPDVASTLSQLAVVQQKQGNVADARTNHERALAIREKQLGPGHPDTVMSLQNLGTVYQDLGRFAEARSYLRRAARVTLQEDWSDQSANVTIISNLSQASLALGDYKSALIEARAAVQISEELGTTGNDAAHNLNNLGFVYEAMGQYLLAREYYEQALAEAEADLGPEHPKVAPYVTNVGGTYELRREYEEAIPYFERALRIDEKSTGPESRRTALSLSNLGNLYKLMGNFAKAEPYAKRALAIRESTLSPTHPKLALSLNNLGGIYQDQDDPAAAQPYFARSMAILVSADVPLQLAQVELNYAGTLRDQGQTPAAILYAKRAVNRVQQTRAGMSSLDSRLQKSFVATKAVYYRSLAQMLIEAGRLPEAQQVLRMLKEREYFDFVRSDAADDPRSTQLSFNQFEREWNESLELAARDQQILLSFGGDKVMRRAQQGYLRTLDKVTDAYAELEESRADQYARMLNTELTADREALLRQVGDFTVLVQLLSVDDQLYALVTTPDGVISRRTEIPRSELNTSIQEFRDSLADPRREPWAPASRLYDWLIAPVAADLDAAEARTILFYLDGPLRYIPMAALYDGENYLVEKYSLAVFTEAVDAEFAMPDRGSRQLAGLGSSRAYEDFSALPAVPRELDGIVKRDGEDTDGVLPGVIYLDDAFTREAFDAVFSGSYPLIHIASHFAFRSGTDTNSYLLLGDGSRLTLADVRSAGFELDAVQLVTLSACETAVGDLSADGREVEGLGTLLQRRGADAVLATLWPVADQSTGDFMRLLYARSSTPGVTKAEALRLVQLSFARGEVDQLARGGERGETVSGWSVQDADANDGISAKADGWSHPYYWAPFILMGNWL